MSAKCASPTKPGRGILVSNTTSRQHWRLAVGGVLLTLLLAAVFTMGSLDVPFEARTWRAVLALYAVSSFCSAAVLDVCFEFGAKCCALVGRAQQRAARRPL